MYDFLALHTLDVDITEDQRSKRLVKEPPQHGEEVWKLVDEEELSEQGKMQRWGGGWKKVT